MEFITFGYNIVVFFIAIALGFFQYEVKGQDICNKFGIGGPCPQVATTTSEPAVVHENPFCQLVCSQGGSDQFSAFCGCPAEATEAPTTTAAPVTTLAPTTTQAPDTTTTGPNLDNCQYISSRPAQLTSKKRLYDPSPIPIECQYPGIVGLYSNPGTAEQQAECNGLLLEEDIVLITEGCSVNLNRVALYALVESYESSAVTSSLPTLDDSTLEYLDTRGIYTALYTVKLSQPVTFDDRCVQPTCVENTKFSAAELDFTDCRIVGLGTTDDFLTSPGGLREIFVEVDTASLTEPELVVTRKDGQTGSLCIGDEGAPLICPHAETGEWITIGVSIGTGIPCMSQMFVKPRIANILSEATIKLYYNALQGYKYAEP